ncbi:hypothetical protein N9467_00905 [Litorivicinus sp.]|nr:hypothetical protein [Litorivicinus sp.]
MSLALKIMLFIGMSLVGISVGIHLGRLINITHGVYPLAFGAIFGAGSWILASKSNKSRKLIHMPLLFLIAGIALVGILPMPYVGYALVRIGVSGACLIAFFTLGRDKRLQIAGIEARYALILIGLLYNPIFPVWLTREIWIVIDLCVAGIAIYLGMQKQKVEPRPQSKQEFLEAQTIDRKKPEDSVVTPASNEKLIAEKPNVSMVILLWGGLGLLALALIRNILTS